MSESGPAPLVSPRRRCRRGEDTRPAPCSPSSRRSSATCTRRRNASLGSGLRTYRPGASAGIEERRRLGHTQEGDAERRHHRLACPRRVRRQMAERQETPRHHHAPHQEGSRSRGGADHRPGSRRHLHAAVGRHGQRDARRLPEVGDVRAGREHGAELLQGASPGAGAPRHPQGPDCHLAGHRGAARLDARGGPQAWRDAGHRARPAVGPADDRSAVRGVRPGDPGQPAEQQPVPVREAPGRAAAGGHHLVRGPAAAVPGRRRGGQAGCVLAAVRARPAPRRAARPQVGRHRP